MWRYSEVLPVTDPQRAVTLGEGGTPLLRAPALGDVIGATALYVKDESGNPTGTFKARGMSAAISKARELGTEEVGVPTAGNAGSAAAAYAARAGLVAHIAMPANTPPAIMDEVEAYGAELTLVDGLISDAGRLVAEGIREHGWTDLSTLKEPYRLEGKKTMGYELWEQFRGTLPEQIVYPTGGGTGLIGMWKAFDELEEMGLIDSRRPRMISVQLETCAPIVRAMEQGAERAEPWENASGNAPGLRVPAPFADDLILQVLRASNGVAVAVSDDEIAEAVQEFDQSEGIDACPEGAATLAGLRKLLEDGRVSPHLSTVLFNTGSGLKHPEMRPRARREAGGG
jgi:threonine synthase